MPAPTHHPRKHRRVRKTSTPSANRIALSRIFKIHCALTHGQRVTTHVLAERLEVSLRTIKRDLVCMGNDLDMPVEWDPQARTYHYTRPCSFLPMLRIDGEEALALVLAGETFAAWKGSALGRALTSVLGKFSDLAGAHISLPAAQLQELLFQHPENAGASEHRHFPELLEHIRHHHALTLSYRKTERANRLAPPASPLSSESGSVEAACPSRQSSPLSALRSQVRAAPLKPFPASACG